MNKRKIFTIVGVTLSGLGALINIASNLLEDAKMKDEIAKQVSEAIAKIGK